MLSGPPVTTTVSAEQLLERFLAANPRQRRSLLSQVQQRAAELRPLLAEQIDRLDATADDWAAGLLIQLLVSVDDGLSQTFRERYREGWLAVTSAAGLDYAPLQRALMDQAFEEADRLTSEHLRQLAGALIVSGWCIPRVASAFRCRFACSARSTAAGISSGLASAGSRVGFGPVIPLPSPGRWRRRRGIYPW
jgi:hypothetical protein